MLHDLNISCWHWLYLSDIVNIKVGELCTKIEILKKGQFDFLFFFHGAVFHNFFATDISDREAWWSPRSQHHMFDATWGVFANVGCCVRACVVRSMWHTGPGKFAVMLKASLLSLSSQASDLKMLSPVSSYELNELKQKIGESIESRKDTNMELKRIGM